MEIIRNHESASRTQYDLVIVGGGIYGVMLALEATLRECSVLLLEKEDFGAATSYNSLRIIHGGLRDLQTFNLKRYWNFGRERRWFLDHFPRLVERLPVLVPLYQRGVMRTEVFRLAFLVDRLLLPDRDRKGDDGRHIPYGRVLSPSEVKQRFPAVDEEDLAGGALWYDACVPDSQRLIIEVLRSVCQMGATALNYTRAVDLLEEQGRVRGVRARDSESGASYQFHADKVVNAAGPWSREVARSFDREPSELHRCSSAWNILFDREAPAECAIGDAPEARAQHYFVHPWKGQLLAGTGYAPREDKEGSPRPSSGELEEFLYDLNRAFPNLGLARTDILHVYSGYLPVKQRGTVDLTERDRWVDHSKHGGPEGLFSVQGTKFTAARTTAEDGITHIFPDCAVSEERKKTFRKGLSERAGGRGVYDFDWIPEPEESSWQENLARILDEESVVHLDDLILRRTSLGDNPPRALRSAQILCDLFDWGEERCRKEVKRVRKHFRYVE